jgi:FKBP-type peptidyl-prolyl cis-trans isomerase
MKLKFPGAVILGVLVVFSSIAQDSSEPPDDEKVSYALGMDLGLEIKRMGADVDVNVIVQAIQDVMDGKATRIPESELRPIFQQEMAYQRAIISKKNKAEGEAFLAKNAALPNITVLPDGLQYRVIQAGSGPMPKIDDNVTISSRGSLISGKVIDQKDHFQVSVVAQMKGFQEALQRMPVGSKWQIFLPPALAFGSDWKGDVGPDSTVMFEIELLSIAPSVHSGGVSGEGANGRPSPHVLGENPQTNTISNSASPPPAGK